MTMYIVSAVAILITMTLAVIRGLLGPTVYDRALAVNMFGTATVLLISVVCFLTGRTDFLDLAILYALLSFVGTIAILKYVAVGDLGRGSLETQPEEEWHW